MLSLALLPFVKLLNEHKEHNFSHRKDSETFLAFRSPLSARLADRTVDMRSQARATHRGILALL